MIIEHNSHSPFSRTPFGAAVCGEKICLRITIGDLSWPDSVILKYKSGEKEKHKRMHFHSLISNLYVFEAFIEVPENPCLVFYHFEISTGGKTYFYGNNERRKGGVGQVFEKSPIPYQITVYDKDYKTPEWFKNSVMYQIFPDRFNKTESYDGLSRARGIIKRDWGALPYHTPEQFGGEYLSNDCFGGSLKGIEEKLSYLKDLGIDAIYLNPIFEAFSNHKYDTADYSKIDPLFGDEEDFSSLCEKAKSLGIRIILDGVFNHTGSDSIYFNKNGTYPETGAYQSESSPYSDWYTFSRFPDEYECWWGIKTLPHVNENSPSYKEYILTGENAIIKKWLKNGASGWRLDVVDELPDEFVKILRHEVKKENPDAVIIGEVWEDASNKTAYGVLREYLSGYELDSAMNYPLKNAIISFSKGIISGTEFNETLLSLKENYPKPAFYAMMNFLSSHDTERIITKLSDLPSKETLSRKEAANMVLTASLKETALRRLNISLSLLFTLPGVPSIFYGDEIGLDGYADPFCRKCYPWNGEKDENLFDTYKHLISLRKSSPAFVSGEIEFVYGDDKALGYLRFTKDEMYLYIANSSSEFNWNLNIELGKYGVFSIKDIYNEETFFEDSGRFNLNLSPLSYRIFKCEVKL